MKLLRAAPILVILLAARVCLGSDEKKLLQYVHEAQELLQNEAPKLIYRNKEIIGRDVPVAVYHPATNKISIVRLRLSLQRKEWSPTEGKFVYVIDWLDAPPGFEIKKISGNGINSTFSVKKTGEEYLFLGWHYIRENSETLVYTPYADYFARQEIVEAGSKYLSRRVKEAHLELVKRNVFSRAIPGRLVHDIIPEQMLYNLAIIEHIDHDEFRDYGDEFMGKKILTQFALNGEKTFSFANSSAGAMCLMQGMRGTYAGYWENVTKRKKKNLKFHKGVQQLYPEAGLPGDPTKGLCDSHSTAIVFAYLVLDDKLSYMPKDFKRNFLSNPGFYGVFLAAAYNGGQGRAIKLYNAYKAMRHSRFTVILNQLFDLFSGPRRNFRERQVLRPETWIFIKKYVEIGGKFPRQE